MDPNATLEEIRNLVAKIFELTDQDQSIPDDTTGELASYVDVLDRWISDGGFLPKAWERK